MKILSTIKHSSEDIEEILFIFWKVFDELSLVSFQLAA